MPHCALLRNSPVILPHIDAPIANLNSSSDPGRVSTFDQNLISAYGLTHQDLSVRGDHYLSLARSIHESSAAAADSRENTARAPSSARHTAFSRISSPAQRTFVNSPGQVPRTRSARSSKEDCVGFAISVLPSRATVVFRSTKAETPQPGIC